MNIEGSKQVGPLYYMVKDVTVLEAICNQGVIRTSLKAEPQSKGGNKYHFVSFMRDLNNASRNPSRWVYGIQLDGDALSDTYRINPYSYAGNAMSGNFYRVKTLTKYDDGSFKLNLVDWPAMDIPEFVYDEIEEMILSDSQHLNDVKKLQVQEGSRAYRGKRALARYNYNVKTGGVVLNKNTLASNALSYLLKHTNLNESEERIWIVSK